MKPKLRTSIVALLALVVSALAPAQDQEISISGTYLNGDLYTGLSGRINQLQNFLGSDLDLDINTFAVTNPRNGAPAAGFSLTGRRRIADNAWFYGGPAIKWEQGQKSVVGLAFGLLVTSPSTAPARTESVVVWKMVDGREVVTRHPY